MLLNDEYFENNEVIGNNNNNNNQKLNDEILTTNSKPLLMEQPTKYINNNKVIDNNNNSNNNNLKTNGEILTTHSKSLPLEPTINENEEILTKVQEQHLLNIVTKIMQPGKGILAADESDELIALKLKSCGLENIADNRGRYRQLIFTTPNIGSHLSGVILLDETFRQKSDKGERLVDLLSRQHIQVGIQIGLDLVPLSGSPYNEVTTQGMDNLTERLQEYRKGGCTFANWRVQFHISNKTPSHLALKENTNLLARYASICQKNNILPCIEPNVVSDGNHSIEECQQVSEQVLAYTYKAFAEHNVFLEGTILKTNMVTSGLSSKQKSTSKEVAERTLTTIKRTVPPAVGGIAFLSSGLTEMKATENLNAINKLANENPQQKPWRLTFCYGRALQATVIKIWQGYSENACAAQKSFLHRTRANCEAEKGEYENENKISLALESVVVGWKQLYY